MQSSKSPRETAGEKLFAVFAVTVLTVSYLVFHFRTHDQESLRAATEHLLQGKTHWIAFQNRLLGPAIIDAIRAITGWSWLRVFYVLVAGCLAGGAYLLLWRSWRDTGRSARGLGQAAAWFFLAFVFNHGWSYPWDYTGALLYLLLVTWARDRFQSLADIKSWSLAALFLALALNRESSLFVLAGLLVTVVIVGWTAQPRPRVGRVTVLIAFAGVANVAAVLIVRRVLFVASTRPSLSITGEMATGNFLQLGQNWQLVASAAEGFEVRWPALAVAVATVLFGGMLLAKAGAAIRARTPVVPGQLFLALCFCFGAAALLLFADARELRVYFEFIPLWVVLVGETDSQS